MQRDAGLTPGWRTNIPQCPVMWFKKKKREVPVPGIITKLKLKYIYSISTNKNRKMKKNLCGMSVKLF